MSGDVSPYAAAEGREFLRGELQDKPNEFVREFAGLIDDPEALDLLNYYCSLWADVGQSFLDSRMAQVIIRNASTRAIDRAYRDGNVSMLKGMTGLTTSTGDGGDAIGLAARKLSQEGAIGLVLGPPGAGKTASTLDVARAWGARTGGRIIGNTSWDGFDAQVTSDRELLEDMASYEGPVLAVLDETAQDLSGYGKDSKKAEQFANSLTFVRKQESDHGPHPKRGSVLMVNHTRKRTAAPFRRLATFAIEKPSRDDPGRLRFLETEGGKDKFEEGDAFKGLTDTRENYSEHEASEFSIVLDEDGDDDGDALDADDVRREAQIETAIRACKPWDEQDGMSYPDAAELVPFADTWVGDRVREWKRGEHRDIVADPEGDSE